MTTKTVQISEEAVRLAAPARVLIIERLRAARVALHSFTDGRDLRPNYKSMIARAQEIVQLQRAADLLGGYPVEVSDDDS